MNHDHLAFRVDLAARVDSEDRRDEDRRGNGVDGDATAAQGLVAEEEAVEHRRARTRAGNPETTAFAEERAVPDEGTFRDQRVCPARRGRLPTTRG